MSREAFEAWFSENGEHPRACMKDHDGQYAYPSARNSYFIWQAARAAALEEAAEVCMDLANVRLKSERTSSYCNQRAAQCAQAVLALKEKE